ncbi:hypothetical protein ACF0H5_011749 [Mactra antiquata]
MPVVPSSRFLLLYGSQTGQAKAISEQIAEKAYEQDLKPELHCLSLTEKKFFLERETCVVIVISTTGDGEPPDTASKFVRRLRKKTLASDYLSKLNYTLLGLGDSNYTNFCNCGKTLDKRFSELGAKRFYNCAWGDDAVGLEEAVDPWIDGLWSSLKSFLQLPNIQENINMNAEQITETTSLSSDNCTPDLTDTNNSCNVVKSTENMNTNSSSDSNHNNSSKTENGTLQTKSDGDKNAESSTSSSVEIEMSANIRQSVPPLSKSSLSLPVMSPSYIKLDYLSDEDINIDNLPRQNDCDFPSASTCVTMATVSDIQKLTNDKRVKKTMLVELDITTSGIEYYPGDSFSVICPNDTVEVNTLLDRLGVIDKKDTCIQLGIIEGTKKKNPSIPKYIPEKCTLYYIFTTCLDIREPPKKALLRTLVEHTHDSSEKRRLQELCSKQGMKDYTEYIRKPSLSILDILNNFTSCKPNVECLIEHLPRLQSRPYSVCTSPLISPGRLQFVFNVVDITKDCGRTYDRKGVCTGWIEQMYNKTSSNVDTSQGDGDSENICDKLEHVKISELLIPVFGRTNQSFHLPDDVSTPLILIGPGTGVAPFIGYLDHRSIQRDREPAVSYGDIWLLYGCRHEKADYLFRDKLESHVSSSILTKLLVSFSRDDHPSSDYPRYVQDNIKLYGSELVHMIEDKNAVIYVCGDANNMAKDVNEAFIEIFSKTKDISLDEARKIILKLRLAKRYKEDVWT